ncbi:MAG: TolC family protein, partial [Candidatus Sericytochromatia bacterium]|nr:TolC family protein [Candidatus Sericytochromatia bacterium]
MHKAQRISSLVATGGLLLALGCAGTLDQVAAREANKALPQSWDSRQAGASDAGAQAPATAQKRWNEFFADADLKALIKTALMNNQELNMRLQEILIAKYEIAARQGEILPKVSGKAGLGLEKVGEYTSQGASDKANGVPDHLPNFAFGFTASWEADIWGKLRNAAAAANHRYLASIEAKDFVVTEIVAEIANSYYELAALDTQIGVIERNVKILDEALTVIKFEKMAARATELAVQKFQAEVLKNKSRTYDLAQQRVEVENRINLLLGRFPQPIARNPRRLDALAPGTVVTGLPSQLLANRPDVKQAEMALEAAKLDVQVAKARFYPSLGIDADAGYKAFNPAHLIDTPQSLTYNVAGNLVAPLLNRASIEAEYGSANAKQVQAVFNFERTLLKAFTEVANALAMTQNIKHRHEQLSRQVETLRKATEVSGILYRSAHADYMEVLM